MTDDSSKKALQQLLDVFEDQWRETPGLDIREFLTSRGWQADQLYANHPTIMLEFLQIDLELRVRRGRFFDDRPLVTHYARDFPFLSASSLTDLAREEIRFGLRLRSDRYRFPEVLTELDFLSAEQRSQLLAQMENESPSEGDQAGPALLESGTQIGRYRILRRLGEGGMGVVYEAEQEEDVRRRVALKIIQARIQSEEILRRFNLERQALAMMDHEHIARVLDAGISKDGQSYFVMELVDGLPITQFCDQERLSIAERLQLFIQACDAIQHAHQKGIVHRDIKPGNVLVTRREHGPQVKVIDFGVAKAIQTDLRLIPETLETGLGRLVGTLQYMSPEQAGTTADIDVRSDVYSLGILLYELLTGSTPVSTNEIRELTIEQLLSIIRQKDPQRPSARLSSSASPATTISGLRRSDVRRLQTELRGDLDWIVMKAIEKERNRRYGGAAQLAEDVQRYLSGQVVIARPPSMSYRLQKLIRRNRVIATATVAVTVILIAATGVSVQLMFQAQAAASRANSELQLRQAAEKQILESRLEALQERDVAADQALLVLRLMTSVIHEQDAFLMNVPGAAEARRNLIKLALTGLQEVSVEHAGSLEISRTFGKGLLELGGLMMDVGRDNATSSSVDFPGQSTLQLAEASFRRADELARLMADGRPSRGSFPTIAADQSSLQLAEQSFRRAAELARLVADEQPSSEAVRDIAVAEVLIAHTCYRQGRYDEAEALYLTTLQRLAPIADEALLSVSVTSLMFSCQERLGDIACRRGNYDFAQQCYQKMNELAGGQNSRAQLRALSVISERLGSVALDQWMHRRAADSFLQCVETRRQLLKDQPKGLQERRDLAIALGKLSDAFIQLDRLDESLQLAEESLRLRMDLNNDNAGEGSQSDLAAAHISLAHVLRELGRYEESWSQGVAADILFQDLCLKDPQNLNLRRSRCIALLVQSDARMLQGRPAEAIELAARCQSLRRELLNQWSSEWQLVMDFVKGQDELSKLQMAAGRYADAEKELQMGLETMQDYLKTHPNDSQASGVLPLLQWNLDGCRMAPLANGPWQDVLNAPKNQLQQLLSARCTLLVPQKRKDELAETARYLLGVEGIDAWMVYDAARALGACSLLELGWDGVSGIPPKPGLPESTPEQQARSRAYQDEAWQAIQRASRAGFADFDLIWAEKEFTGLRTMPEFRTLCKRELQTQAPVPTP